MNRPIKFRAWSETEKEWYDPTELWVGGTGIVHAKEGDVILEQFTGLHDKNGKEIYEGDCLSGGGFVVWDERKGGWAIRQGDTQHLIYENFYQAHALEVIGNIHENPELLK